MSGLKFAQTVRAKGVEADLTIDLTASQYQSMLDNKPVSTLGPLFVEAVLMQTFRLGASIYDTWFYPESGECKVVRSYGNLDEE